MAAQNASAAYAIRAAFGFCRIATGSFAMIATKITTISSRLDSLVRYVAAIARPVSAPSNRVGLLGPALQFSIQEPA